MSDDIKVRLARFLPNVEERERWLQVIYAETWKQYAHEDQIAQTRSHVFLVIQAALTAFLAAISISLVKAGCATVFGISVHLGLCFVGTSWTGIGLLLWILNNQFQRVTWAGRQYVNMRHAHLRALEHASVGNVGPALLEDHWRDLSQGASGEVAPFSHLAESSQIEDISRIKVFPFNGFGGFTYLFATADVWKVVYVVIIAVGIGLLIVGAFPEKFAAWVPSVKC